jgi:hypothetical protein
MSLIVCTLVFITGGFFTVTLMSCFAVAKLADERREKIFVSLGEGGSSKDLFNAEMKINTCGLPSGLRHG